MHIRIDRLTASPKTFRFQVDTLWWQTHMPKHPGLPGQLEDPFQILCEARLEAEELVLAGSLEGGVNLECGRCLTRYRQALREPFRLALEPARSRISGDPEAAAALRRDGVCVADNFEAGWYQGTEIQLDTVCLEVISLALPVQPLCKSDCSGLCERCGVDRNRGECSCEGIRPPSPFDVLASLRGDGSEGVQ